MCGIFTLLNNNDIPIEFVEKEFEKGKNRGPESSKLLTYDPLIQLGFHRLAINGLNEQSNQPFLIDNVHLICNGEIYNYKYLYELMDKTPQTGSDCEVIIHLYLRYGIEQTLQMLDGVFAFVLHDLNLNHVYVARDPFGVRPLYRLSNLKHFKNLVGFASNLNCLNEFIQFDEYMLMHDATGNDDLNDDCYKSNSYHYDYHVIKKNASTNANANANTSSHFVEHFTPGSYSMYTFSFNSFSWVLEKEKQNVPFFIPTHCSPDKVFNWDLYREQIRDKLMFAVWKRCIATERPVACLLSGGLDSSLIASIVNDIYRFHFKKSVDNFRLETYSIGLQGSVDLHYARIMAEHLNSNHHEVIVTEREMFEAIPEVIAAIETFDTTSVRASIGNYLLGKYIASHSEAKVIFNGDGSDELCGGYLYMSKCEDAIEFDKETRRLLKDIHKFDVLRSDKSISSHGLEPRTPFLDKTFVNYYLSIPPYVRQHTNYGKMEKYLLRSSFSKEAFENELGLPLLPDSILWRRKEAFSDGVAGQNRRPLFVILQEFIGEKLGLPASIETEKYYYKLLYNQAYPKTTNLVPYFWMPKYMEATDPSARTLSIYQHEKDKETEK